MMDTMDKLFIFFLFLIYDQHKDYLLIKKQLKHFRTVT